MKCAFPGFGAAMQAFELREVSTQGMHCQECARPQSAAARHSLQWGPHTSQYPGRMPAWAHLDQPSGEQETRAPPRPPLAPAALPPARRSGISTVRLAREAIRRPACTGSWGHAFASCKG